jgi:hypothetical protein
MSQYLLLHLIESPLLYTAEQSIAFAFAAVKAKAGFEKTTTPRLFQPDEKKRWPI